MNTNEIIMLVGLVVVGYFLLKFLWNVVGNLIKLAVVVILIGIGTYIYNPILLYNVFGETVVEASVGKGIAVVENVIDWTKEKLTKEVTKTVTLD